MKKKKPAVKKIVDLKVKLEAYRASALAAGNGSARPGPGNLALASAAAGGAALAMAPAAEATIQYSGPQNIMVTDTGIISSTLINMDGVGPNEFQIFHYFDDPQGIFLATMYPKSASGGIVYPIVS